MRHSHSSAARGTPRVAVPIHAPGPPDAPDAPSQWVICGGAIREAVGGRVSCPLQGRAVALGECIGCHCLVTHSGERDPLTDCVLPAVS